jgi:hypothetical protein
MKTTRYQTRGFRDRVRSILSGINQPGSAKYLQGSLYCAKGGISHHSCYNDFHETIYRTGLVTIRSPRRGQA